MCPHSSNSCCFYRIGVNYFRMFYGQWFYLHKSLCSYWCLAWSGFLGSVHVHWRGEKTSRQLLATKQEQGILLRLLVKNMHSRASGGCAQLTVLGIETAAIYRCGLRLQGTTHRHSGAPHKPNKAAAACVNQLVSQQSLCQGNSRHRKRDANWVS